MGEHTGSIQDIINLTENLDCYDVYPDIEGYEDLGRYYIDELEAMQVRELKPYYERIVVEPQALKPQIQESADSVTVARKPVIKLENFSWLKLEYIIKMLCR